MTAGGTGTQVSATEARVRTEGDVDAEAPTYVPPRSVRLALGRPGLPAVSGEVRIARTWAHHAEHPWSAEVEILVGNALVVLHALEASAHELADRLLHHRNAARRSATAPPGGAVGREPDDDFVKIHTA
ncbi:hypothetical protein OHA71_08195 [Streptomyces sp. NBC_00444]|uniref:hypothetical protein n=1 Tax=Streptomyces sp. NBC_00444 TaxID=2975744 RepID=UPI002E23E704